MKVATADQMRSIESAAVERGISLASLMQRAGEHVARVAAELSDGGPILILVGPGNNGGDGLVAATWLFQRGHEVAVYTFKRPGVGTYPGSVVRGEEDQDLSELNRLARSSAVVVDALLGIGQSRAPEGLLAAILQRVNGQRSHSSRGIAVDIPTGVNADSGAAPGEAFRADLTLCMGLLKCGDVLYPGAGYAGRVQVVDVGIPEGLEGDVMVEVPSAGEIASLLPERNANSNKGSYGRLLVVAGSRDFLGAPALAGTAAYRAGAGLVEAAVTAYVQQSVAAHVLETVYTQLPEDDGRIPPGALPLISQALDRADALVFGPGLGLSSQTIELTRGVLGLLANGPVHRAVVDADGLNALAQIDRWWEVVAKLVLTPHPGEMSRLTGRSIPEIQHNRLVTAQEFAAAWQKVVVLKGAGTVIASPDGKAAVNPTGGPNLATAGTGDVLSGVIGGLLAQGCDPFEAAVAGVYWHGRAGDLLRGEHGDAGTIASDLLAVLPSARLSILEEDRSFNKRQESS